jgi:hypothetical protein
LNEIKKLEKETETGSIDFDEADQDIKSLKKEFKGSSIKKVVEKSKGKKSLR